MPSGAQCVHGTTNHLRRSSEGPAAEDRAEEGPGIALVAGAQPDQSVADQAASQKAADKSGPSASTAAASRTAADLGEQAGPRRRTRTDPALEDYTCNGRCLREAQFLAKNKSRNKVETK